VASDAIDNPNALVVCAFHVMPLGAVVSFAIVCMALLLGDSRPTRIPGTASIVSVLAPAPALVPSKPRPAAGTVRLTLVRDV